MTNQSNQIASKLRFKLFQSKAKGSKNQWFFNIQSRNGNIIAASEGYSRRANALKTLALLLPVGARVEVAS